MCMPYPLIPEYVDPYLYTYLRHDVPYRAGDLALASYGQRELDSWRNAAFKGTVAGQRL